MDEEEELRLKAQARLRLKQQKEKANPEVRYQTKPNETIFPDWMVKNEKEVVTMDGPKGKEEIMDLPEISDRPYEGLDKQSQIALYEAYLKHPKTQRDAAGAGVYKGKVVPLPVEDTSSGIAGGVWNMGRNIVEGVAAGGEYAGVLPEGSVDTVQQIPAYRPSNTKQVIGSTVGEIGGSIGLGGVMYKGIASLGALAPKVGQATSYMAKVLAQMAAQGTSAGMSFGNRTKKTEDGNYDVEGNSNWVVGPDSYVLKGIDTKSPTEAEAIVKDRLNIAADAAVLAGVIEPVADVGKKFGSTLYHMFVENIHGGVSRTKAQKIVANTFWDKVAAAAGAQSPQEREVLMRETVDILRKPENKKIILNIDTPGVDNIDINLDTAQAVRRGLKGDKSQEAAAVEGVFNDENRRIIGAGGEGLKAASEQPQTSLKNLADQTEEIFGGPMGQTARVNSEATAREIQKAGQQEVGSARADLEAADVATQNENAKLPEILSPVSTNKTGSESYDAVKGSMDEIMANTDEGNNFVKNTQSEKYADVGKTEYAQADGTWNELVDELIPSKEHMALGAKPYNIPVPLKEAILGAGDDYRKLVTDVKPKLSETITAFRKAAEEHPEKADYQLIYLLEKMQKNISKVQPELLKGTPAAEAASKADKYTKEVFGETVGKGVNRKVEEIRSSTSDRFDIPKQNKMVRKAVKSTIENENPDELEHFVKTLSRYEYNKSHMKVLDYARAKIADQLRSEIASVGEGIGEINPKGISDTLAKYRTVFKEFPEARKQLDVLEENILKNRGNVKKLKGITDQFSRTYDEIADEIYNDTLQDFFKKNGTLKENASESFQSVFTSKQNIAKVRKLNEIVQKSGNDVVKDGWKAAYLNALKKEIFPSVSNVAPDGGVNIAKGSDLLEKNSTLMNIGDEIFKDKPIIMQSFRELIDPSVKTAVEARKRPTAAMNDALRKAKSEVGTLTRFWFGPLTRRGTITNAAAGKLLEYMDPGNVRFNFAEAMMRDSDTFVKITEDLLDEATSDSRKMRTAFTFLVRAGIYNENDYKEYQADVLNNDAKVE